MVSDNPNRSARIIYVSLFLLLIFAISTNISFAPVRLNSADKAFEVVEQISGADNKVALVGLEYGPGTQAENDPQARAVLEHLFRKNIPVIVFTTYALAEKFTTNTPESIAAQINSERVSKNPNDNNLILYGKNWINLGYRPGGSLFFQALSQSKDLAVYLGKDYKGQPLSSYQSFTNIKSLSDISIIGYFSGLVGILNTYIQFLQVNGAVPIMVHGCTSISIPETFIFLESGQLKGLLEGVAGAAWYSKLLRQKYGIETPSSAESANSILGIGQIFILILIILGNLVSLKNYFYKTRISNAAK
jgi:hypothetical protein